MIETPTARVLGPRDGNAGFLGSIGVRFMIDGAESGGGFSLVEHPMSARALAAPLHRHTREDEYSYVLEGRVGALLGDEVVIGAPGDLIFKPRHQWHTFWNAGDEPARLLEIIAPAGFEQFFAELVELGGSITADRHALMALSSRYGLDEARDHPGPCPALRSEVPWRGDRVDGHQRRVGHPGFAVAALLVYPSRLAASARCLSAAANSSNAGCRSGIDRQMRGASRPE